MTSLTQQQCLLLQPLQLSRPHAHTQQRRRTHRKNNNNFPVKTRSNR